MELRGGFNYFFIVTLTWGNDIFQMGWFNHQPEKYI